ncbi:cytochrome P450 81Q32 [Helianthus annuus]|uniref:cytochrome P450 81Q32 n=1 Tax=Helianthus annuus TaxID=4232 RepID=UPI00165305B3|nr:cytochrome P450 81Q32 [Helianthus annuus]
MEVPYLYISLLLLLASYLFTSHFRRKSANLPPTIFPTLPIIGHLYLLKPPIYRTLSDLSAKYGPVLLLQLGFRRVLLISSPSAAEECFTKNDIIFANRPHMLYGKFLANNYTSLVFSSYGENWRHLRRIASNEILSPGGLNGYCHMRIDKGKLMIRKLMMTSSSPVNMNSVFYELMLNVMMRMICGKWYFGVDIPEMEEGNRLREIIDETELFNSDSVIADYLPQLSWFGNRAEKRFIALQEKRDVFVQELIEQVRKSKGETKEKTMIEALLSLQESDPEYYTDQMIRSLVIVFLSAGTDTSVATMEWSLSLLLNHPQVLQNAQSEIDTKIGKDRLVEESDIAELPYIRWIMNETFRLYPVTPLLLPHESSEDCTIEGYNVPRGTMLLVNQWAIQNDPKLWTDPERFYPERFKGVEGTKVGFKLLPFGSGRRRCPEDGLAIRVFGPTLALLIQCFDWERLSEEMVDMKKGQGFTMHKAEPLVAKCKPRPEMQHLLAQL